jgi:hypothetical protein
LDTTPSAQHGIPPTLTGTRGRRTSRARIREEEQSHKIEEISVEQYGSLS